MISAQDKRFKEIERMVGGLVTKIEALEAKVSDYDFVKESLNALSANISLAVEKLINQDKQIKENLGLADKNHGFLHGLINDLTKYLEGIKKDFTINLSNHSVTESTVSRILEKLEFIDKRFSTVSLKNDSEKRNEEVVNQILGFDEKISALKREFSSNIHSVNEALLRQVAFIENTLHTGYQTSDSKISQRIDNITESIQQKFANLSNPKDFLKEKLDPVLWQIQDLKNDLANILRSTSEMPNHIPLAIDYSEKFKTLENSIAAIFTMLKKYERG